MRIEDVARILYQVNQLTSFKLNSMELEDWSATILRRKPDVKADEIQEIIDKYMNDTVEWERHKGIQNILFFLVPPERGLVY